MRNNAIFQILMTALLASLAFASPASAEPELAHGPRGLYIDYRAQPADRPAFRDYLVTTMAPELRKLKAEGVLSDFRIYYSWFAQPEVWDAMVELHFARFEDAAVWNRIERSRPGGLTAAGLRLAKPVRTIAADVPHDAGPPASEQSVFYMLPYEYNSGAEYRAYLAGYVLPQFDGWRAEGSLAGYRVAMNRYPVGPPWDSLAILEYRDLTAFGQRQAVLDKVREGLREDPVWADFHPRKGRIRSETENVIADLIAQ